MKLLSGTRYCECGVKIKESIIERMFFHEDGGKFSWTTFGAANGYVMLWMLFYDYYINGRAVEMVLSWSVAIIGLMIGIRPAQKGLESLGRGISGAVGRKQVRKEIKDAQDVKVETAVKSEKIVRPTDPRNVKGRWIVTLDGKFLTISEWQKLYGVSGDNIGKYFTASEHKWNYQNLVVSEAIIRLIDDYRESLGGSVSLTSLYRPGDDGSAHGFGLAMDVPVKKVNTGQHDSQGKPIYEVVRADGEKKAKLLQDSAKKLGYTIRISWYSYWSNRLGCIHVDVAPMYFKDGGVFRKLEVVASIVNKFKKEMVNGW